jgi:hypothetical protein
MRSCNIEVIMSDITNASILENMDCVAERAMLCSCAVTELVYIILKRRGKWSL